MLIIPEPAIAVKLIMKSTIAGMNPTAPYETTIPNIIPNPAPTLTIVENTDSVQIGILNKTILKLE